MTTSLRVVLVLLGLSLIALTVTGEMIYSRMVTLWLLLLGVNWGWAKLTLKGIQLQRIERIQRAQVGQVFAERFEIRNTGHIPILWLEVWDHSGLQGGRSSRVLTMIWGKQTRSYLVRNRLTKRGLFSFGPTRLTSGDIFGLFLVSQNLPARGSLMVLPIMVDVYAFPGPAGSLPGGEALRRITHMITPNASGVREYSPGDPMKRIHWASTARRDRLMVKEFELDPLAEVWIFLDADRDVQAAMPFTALKENEGSFLRPYAKVSLPPSTEEYAVSIAASLGRFYLRRGRAVGLVSSAQVLEVLPPDRSGRQLGKILEVLAVLRGVGDLPFPALVSAQARHLSRGSTVILITPSDQQEVVWSVDQLLRLKLSPVVILLDAVSFGGSSAGTESPAASIQAMDVPVYLVENGANLKEVLNSGYFSFDR